MELREELSAEGAVFNSETDTETIVHLIERYLALGQPLVEAVRQALVQLQRRARHRGDVIARAG